MSNRFIAVIDMKAFYASIECVERGLDPLKALLVVTDTTRKESTIVLSVSHALKIMGVPSRCRRRDLPKIKDMIYAIPQMEKYVKKSAEIVSIFLDFIGEDDLHIYSIDECFLNLGPYLKLYKCTAKELVKKILTKIKDQTGLIATAGIGPNMFLAKVADDIEAKKNKDFIAEWTYDDVKTKLWPLKPLNKMWGVSQGYTKSLNQLGIYTVGDLANYNKNDLIDRFGLIGEELYNHANGIDEADIREKYLPLNKGLSIGQVLMRDYTKKETVLIIKEMCDELTIRLRKIKKNCGCVHLAIGYSSIVDGGFYHQIKLLVPTSTNSHLLKGLMHLFNTYCEDKPIRRVCISYTDLTNKGVQQLSLFSDIESIDSEEEMFNTLDEVMHKFGKNSISRTSALKKESTLKERHNQIGGHRK